MFFTNKYTKWYFQIIENGQQSSRSKKTGYYEKHHIIPRTMGGTNESDNLVLLTAKEHFICHLLLLKMVKSGYYYHKMLFALNAMSRVRGDKKAYSSVTYAYLRPKIAQAISAINKGKPKPGTSAALKDRPKSTKHRAALAAHLVHAREMRQLKTYQVVTPGGTTIVVTNRKEYCTVNGLSITEFSRRADSGKKYRGYTITTL